MASDGPTILAEGEGDIIADLVFVHGLRGNTLDTWSKGNICWPRDLLKNDLHNVRIIAWGYDSQVANVSGSASQASLFSHAENLLQDISDLRRSGSAPTRPLFFICHSLGGLVVKQALIRSSEIFNNRQNPRLGSIYPNTKAVIFLGTPHRGSGKTTIAHFVSLAAKATMRQPNNKLIEALEQDSQVLEQQRKSFSSISSALELICFAEEKPMTPWGMIVPEYSATIDGFNVQSSSIPSDHIGMCKFQSNRDVGYRRILAQLRDMLDPEPGREEDLSSNLGSRDTTDGRTPLMLEAAVASESLEAHPEEVQTLRNERIRWASWQLNEAFDSLAFPQMFEREDTIDDPYQDTFKWILPYADSTSNTDNDRTPAKSNETSSARKTSISNEIIESPIRRQDSLDIHKELAVSQFSDWLKSPNSSLFWISGKAASGKSTLMKHVHQRSELTNTFLKGYVSHPRLLTVASFFFYDQGKSTLQKSREGLLRSLLYQLLLDKERLWNKSFDSICQKVFRRSYQRNPKEPTPEIQWSWSDLEKTFDSMVSQISGSDLKVFLMIDGLDEFRLTDDFNDYLEYEDNEDSLQARRNLKAHRTIAQFVLKLSASPAFKILLSSRPLQVFEDSFSSFPGFRIQDLTSNDIREFVEQKLGTHPWTITLLGSNVTRTREIFDEVTSKACGVFLWVKLVVNILIDCLDAGDDLDLLHAKVKEVPPALRGPEGLYAKMLASILPENRAEGAALFGRVLFARGYLTVLSLSFSQESPAYALTSPTERISQNQFNMRVKEINRRLKSRCAGLLESVRNPHLSKALAQYKWRTDEVPWNFRPHEAVDPVVTFVHRTAIEYLQSPWHSYDDMLVKNLNHKIYEQLLVSCVLRAKFIGRTLQVWEIFHVVNDAIKYAKNVEDRTGASPIHLLDELKRTVEHIWEAGMSAGRPSDYNGDPGYGQLVIQRRKEKNVPQGPLQHLASVRGPLWDLQDADAGSFLTLAAQGGLVLYVQHALRNGDEILLKAGSRPVLASLLVPRSSRSPLENFPLLEDEEFPWPSSSTLELFFGLGMSINDSWKGKTIWHAALTNPLMYPVENLISETVYEEGIEVWGTRVRLWAKAMTLLTAYEPDVVKRMSTGEVPLEYMLNLLNGFASITGALQEIHTLLLQLIHRSADCGVIPSIYKNITTQEVLGLRISDWLKLFNFNGPDEHSKRLAESLKERLYGEGANHQEKKESRLRRMVKLVRLSKDELIERIMKLEDRSRGSN